MYDVIIIGKGPAGISASLYTKRANLSTLVIGKDNGALQKISTIENYYGIMASGAEIFEAGIKQAEELGVKVKTEEVVSISYDENFTITTNKAKYNSKAVLLATGANRKAPSIKGIIEYEGKGVSYCAICDGFFYRQKDVAVLGSGEYAIHEVQELLNLAKTITILTNGDQINTQILPNYRTNKILINEKKIKEVTGENILKQIKFLDGTQLPISGLFIAEGTASSLDFARKLGASIEKNKIIVNEKMQTNIPGLYAAGDCTGGLLQVSKAVSDGAIAGTEINKFIMENKR